MAKPRPFRFGVDLQASLPGRSFADSTRELEALGFSTVFVPDHFDEGLGPITAMATAAAATTTLNVGSLVLDCDFRHPAVLARELASIDLLSEGRLEVGLGAGWKRLDYDRSGLTMDPPRVRVDRMIEHTRVLKGLFADGPLSFAGEHYTITELDGTPPPHRPGGPPILIAGGARRVLTFAGEIADIVGVNASIHSGEVDTAAAKDSLADRFDEKVAWVRDGAVPRFDDIEINAWIAIASLTDDGAAVAESLAPMYETDANSVRSSPLTLIGSLDEITGMLEARRARWGYSYIVLPGAQTHELAPVVAALAGK
ncbi:MAG TPA: TIGR03621 family F420-dependent LLM class oxidoreductase [Acidimicrobiales bacterium]|jgi:probable F420-dependent oxidoreductase|nr:TIGR03621 family F420-dependent LLM class oxidoreductase [Acidimicrobiales bacterium]